MEDLIGKKNFEKEYETEASTSAIISSKIKEGGLYVGVDKENNFFSPKEIVNRDLAHRYLKDTSDIVSKYYNGYKKLKGFDIGVLTEYYREMISLYKKHRIKNINGKNSYEDKHIEMLKSFSKEAQEIAAKYGF